MLAKMSILSLHYAQHMLFNPKIGLWEIKTKEDEEYTPYESSAKTSKYILENLEKRVFVKPPRKRTNKSENA